MIRLISGLLVGLVSIASAWAQTAGPAPASNVWYGVVSRSSGRALDVSNASPENGARAVQWEFTQAQSQQWRFTPVTPNSTYYRIEVRHSGKALTLDGPADNAAVTQQAWSGSFYQQWRIVPAGPAGSFQLASRGNDFSLALASADKANATPVVGQRALGRASQQWWLFPLKLNVATDQPAWGPPTSLGPGVNSVGNELQPVLSPDGSTLYFARNRFAGNTEGNTESADIWVSRSSDGGRTWGLGQRLDALNTPQNNGVMAVVENGKALLIRGHYERDGSFRDDGLSRADLTGKQALKPEPLDITNYYSNGTSTTFFAPADEKVLLLSLERPDAYGANDLYVSLPGRDGTWGEPRNLGNGINSPGFEFAPWLTPDGRTLYFASYGHAGYGSADIFVSHRLDDSWTSWSAPQNLGPGINGPGFDAYFQLTADGKQAYFAQARTANGPADIVRAEVGAVVPPAPDTTAKPVAGPALFRASLSGRVLDAKTRKPVAASIKLERLDGTTIVVVQARSEASGGTYQLLVPPGRYRVAATAGGFLTATDTLNLTTNQTRDLLVVPASVGSRLELPTLIFAQGKFTMLPASYTELNRLASTLIDNPTVNIRLEGHTDNVGDARLNVKLSEERVTEVKRYLVRRGVAETRISTIGYGGSKPRASNDREETRRLNRRVEFTIVK
ncbi:RICIN domain-containing protein [Hymenobacter sp. J193]|uniref:RICIN domain-containing protein n=1 Tax=Hymenobacter sp. J193 TaxID=2898429 RepID=UPI002150EAA1|nr:RICIN domain-containing protein [Hymenobacter sp. J193]MCR5889329.1 RICIN domain-containing protein [Hymenobacter sp. J193]